MNETETSEYVCEACDERFETERELDHHVRDVGLAH